MKGILIGSVLVAVVAFIAWGSYLAGRYLGLTDDLRALGLTRRSSKLYKRAMDMLGRLVSLSDLDGITAGDIISPQTRQEIDELLTEYRKELHRR